jgi:DNA-binding HxlR family transcriptional regulator
MKYSNVVAYNKLRGHVDGKWKLLILLLLNEKPQRFNKMKQLLKTVSSKMLSRALTQMIDSELVVLENAVYYITHLGKELCKHYIAIIKLLDTI